MSIHYDDSFDLNSFNLGYKDGFRDAHKWIECTDRMPEKNGRYLVVEDYITGVWIGVSSMRDGKWDSCAVQFWMELPRIPESSHKDY